jgi:signal transduction histidine kinase
MSPRKTAKVAFVFAVVLLLCCGAAAMVAMARYSGSVQWVDHTYEVKVAAGRLESALSEAARDRLSYITAGEPRYLERYEAAKKGVLEDLPRARQLVLDNPVQLSNFQQLGDLVNKRIGLLQSSLDARASGRPDAVLQTSVSLENTKIASEVGLVVQKIQDQEDTLLAARKNASSRLFVAIFWLFGVMLASALLLLRIHYALLNQELGKREEAEKDARRLSVHVLELQDEERRKFSRELHDGLGQILNVAKMAALGLAGKHPADETVPDLIDTLDRSIQETRTISYLLHPPMLDEFGIVSAANWYLEGFSQRSGVQVSSNISNDVGRLPRPVELVLFRVLQESLTNIHRHAKSQKAEVAMFVSGGAAVLRVRDYGVGIPSETLRQFQTGGSRVGVGLRGMCERVREHGGEFELRSSEGGTELEVRIPLLNDAVAEPDVAATSSPV